MSLSREKKKKQLADAMKEAGVGQGAKGIVSDKVKQAVSNIGKNAATREVAREVGTGGLSSKIRQLKDAEASALAKSNNQTTGQVKNEAMREQQVANRYSKVPVSPIYSNGRFSRNSDAQIDKNGNRLTEDDKVPSTSKKKNRRQY